MTKQIRYLVKKKVHPRRENPGYAYVEAIRLREKCIWPRYDLNLWSLTLKAFSAIITQMMNIWGKFHRNASTQYRDIASREIGVNGVTDVHRTQLTGQPAGRPKTIMLYCSPHTSVNWRRSKMLTGYCTKVKFQKYKIKRRQAWTTEFGERIPMPRRIWSRSGVPDPPLSKDASSIKFSCISDQYFYAWSW